MHLLTHQLEAVEVHTHLLEVEVEAEEVYLLVEVPVEAHLLAHLLESMEAGAVGVEVPAHLLEAAAAEALAHLLAHPLELAVVEVH